MYEKTYRLTEAQEGLWFAQSIDPQNPIFNTAQFLRIYGPLNIEAFREAVNSAMAEAEGLNVRISERDGVPYQNLLPADAAVQLEIVDAGSTTAAQSDLLNDANRPLDLSVDSPARQVLYVISQEEFIWYQRIHHTVIDGYGTDLLVSRISDLYNRAADQQKETSGSHTRPFGRFQSVIDDDESYRESDKRRRDFDYWESAFSPAPETGSIIAGNLQTSATYLRHSLPPYSGEQLSNISDRLDIPWPDILVTIVGEFIARHTTGGECVVGIPSMGRLGTPAANVPAMVMNVVPHLIPAEGATYTTVHHTLKRARRHARYRSEQLRRDLGLLGENKRLYGPLINILPFSQSPSLAHCETRLSVLSTGPVDDLTVTIRCSDPRQGLKIELDANPEFYTDQYLRDFGTRFHSFYERVLTSGDDFRLSQVTTLTDKEYRRLVEEFNDTAHDIPSTTLVDLISTQVARTPEALAVVDADRKVTFAELDEQAAVISDWLRSQGIRRGDIVGVALPRSVDLLVSLLAVMRCGAAYLPIDLTHPRSRLEVTLQSSGTKLVIAAESDTQLVPVVPGVVLPRINGIANRDTGRSAELNLHASVEIEPGDAAYVIYTSGSTGEPKGVVVEHDAIVNRLLWMQSAYGIGSGDNVLQKTPITFDVSVWELFLPLISGATLYMAPPESHRDPAWLATIINEWRISVMHFVPSMLAAFLDEPRAATVTSLTRVFCSGEALPAGLRDRFHRTIKSELHNLYGPTEAAVDVTEWNASADDTSRPVPIGKPVWNTQMYVLDRMMRPVPELTVGDLYIGGRQLARGYLGNPELTAEKFVDRPETLGGAQSLAPVFRRIYNTGDLAYWTKEGALVYVGRSDDQVKIRGLRVELGDISSAILQDRTIADAAVIISTHSGSQELVAYVVPALVPAIVPGDQGSRYPIDLNQIRERIAGILPDYMVPAWIIELDEMPLSSSGKLDRRALPRPVRADRSGGKPPATPTEIALADIYKSVLVGNADNTEHSLQVSADDDFFVLGGHSLLAAKLMLAVRTRWECDLRLGAVFAHPTVERLAAQIDLAVDIQSREETATSSAASRSSSSVGLEPLIRLSGSAGSAQHGSDVSALTPIFCIHPAGGISWCYGALSRELARLNPSDNRTVYALQSWALQPGYLPEATLPDMAADYCAQIEAVYPRGPVLLLGWSVGGIIAHEMAVQLERGGRNAPLVAMLDSYPSDIWRDEPAPDESAALRALVLIAGIDPDSMNNAVLSRSSVIELLRKHNHPLGDLTDENISGVIRAVENNARLVRSHRHSYYNGRILHFGASLDHQGTDLSHRLWHPYAAEVVSIGVNSVHAHITGTAASHEIAPHLLNEIASQVTETT